MDMPRTEDIAEMSAETIAELIEGQRRSRNLSALMRSINRQLLEGDASEVRTARAALAKMGFTEAD